MIVTGCLAERYAKEIAEQIPEVDAVIGTNAYDEIVSVIHEVMEGHKTSVKKPLNGLPKNYAGRTLTTGGHFAHLKIAEGCDKHCTYCVIPSIRGNYRSVPMEDILAELACITCGRRCQGTDLSCPGDNALWRGSLWQKNTADLIKKVKRDRGDPLDPFTILLSGTRSQTN